MPSPVAQTLQLRVLTVERSPYLGLHCHFERPHWAISHVLFGNAVTSRGAHSFEAPRGSVMIHPPGQLYVEQAFEPGTHEWFLFDCELEAHLELLRLHPLPPVLQLRDSGAFSRAFEALLRAWNAPESPFRALQVTSAALETLTVLLQEWREQGEPPRPAFMCEQSDRFARLVAFLHENLDRKITRETLSRQFHLHPNSLDRAFCGAHGQTPTQMLRELRLQRAASLLGSTDLTLDAIAKKCGFEDDAHLSHAFKAKFGQTPGVYRAGVKKATEGYTVPLFNQPIG